MATNKDPNNKRHNFASMGLQARFHLGLAVIFLIFCSMITLLLYFYEKQALEDDALQQSEMVMTAVEAVRGYVGEVLRPEMYKLAGADAFIPAAMSTSYISRMVMKRMRGKMPGFTYRRVAVNARNSNYEANDLEVRMINYFKSHPQRKWWRGIKKINSQQYYFNFRPIRFSNSCMRCHGSPAAAPAAMVNIYGRRRGFHQRPGQIDGVQSVGIPVDVGLVRIMRVAWTVFFVTVLGLFFLYGVILFFFNKMIVHNLKGLLDILRDNLRDETGKQLYEQARSKDEMGEMSLAVLSVADHLHHTHRRLEDYAENLEKKVQSRTLALRESRNELQKQAVKKGRELRTLNVITELITQSTNLADILPRVLSQALSVTSAQGGGIYLLDRDAGALRLQCREKAPSLISTMDFDSSICLPLLDEKSFDFDGFLVRAMDGGQALNQSQAEHDIFHVPICCRQQVLGVMTFIGPGIGNVDAEMLEFLFSIGHQIGITIESINNINRLLHSKELLQTVFDGITDVVMLLDRDNRVQMVNKSFLTRHGVSLQEVINQPLEELQLCAPCPFMVMRRDVFKKQAPLMRQVNTEEGSIYEISLYPIFVRPGELRNMVCYAKDITEQKRVEERMQQTEKLAALGRLAAGVAHEINNPLGVILCYTDILLGEPDAGAEQRSADVMVIEKHARSCQRIVSDLLNFSRGRSCEKSNSQLNDLIQEVIRMTDGQLSRKEIDFTARLDPRLPELFMDRERLKQVLLNLLMNAVDAIAESGSITVYSRYLPGKSRVEVIIEDDGMGIRASILPAIFDPFFTTKPPGMGTGLGLAVSYGIIGEHGGEIRAESEEGKGSRFIIILSVSSSSRHPRP